ncbi:MAG: hypothetical protein IJL63_01880 [Clostridia bacterium]|nr:hypothetical protein [Clostridia bacterium]
MLRVFFAVVFLCLVLFGTLALSYAVMLKSLVPKKRYDYYIIIPSKQCGEKLASAAYQAKMKIDLLGDTQFGKVLVVNTGMSDEQKLTCLNICRKTNGIFLVDKDQIEEIIG